MEAELTDEILLGLLADADGGAVAGEVLSGKLGLDPSRVWRHIDRLRVQGYRIDRVGAGYRLVSVPDRLSPLEITPFLTTHDFGRGLHYREEVPSTNDVARRLAKEGAFHGEVVVAERQTRGRGRRGRLWISPPMCNVYLSAILRPALPPMRVPEITFVAAVAVAETVREALDLPLGIKWPNDLELEGRKVAGILTELESGRDATQFVVLGLGLNVNMPESELPEELRPVATTLRAAAGTRIDRPLLTAALLAGLERWYDRWTDEGFGPVREAWRGLSSTLGREVRVVLGDGHPDLVGVADDVDETGALMVRRDDGTVERVLAGDVVHLRRA